MSPSCTAAAASSWRTGRDIAPQHHLSKSFWASLPRGCSPSLELAALELGAKAKPPCCNCCLKPPISFLSFFCFLGIVAVVSGATAINLEHKHSEHQHHARPLDKPGIFLKNLSQQNPSIGHVGITGKKLSNQKFTQWLCINNCMMVLHSGYQISN